MDDHKTLVFFAQDTALDDLAEVVEWRLNPFRNDVVGANDVIDKAYIVGADEAVLPVRVSEKLRELESEVAASSIAS